METIYEDRHFRITHKAENEPVPFTLWVSFHGRWVMDSQHRTEAGATQEADAMRKAQN